MAETDNDSAHPAPDIRAGRLSAADYIENFSDLHPPLTGHEAYVEADRCYFCYDAPCTIACPTSIDIPMFIRQISAGQPKNAAKTILGQNIMGGMCARVCPVETLCEEACVRMAGEGKPVKIGQLQRYATDALMAEGGQPFQRAGPTGKRIAVVGAGPAGLSCAHRLAMHGHEVTVFDAREKPGGLNEYGIASYKTLDDFARREVDFITGIGGITLKCGKALGRDIDLAALRAEYDAVFLGIGLAGVNALGVDDEASAGTVDAVGWIAGLRQSDLAAVPVGRNVVVIGGGMTAIDAAVQAKKLGADEVTIVYRRGPDNMNASVYEQEVAQTSGVTIRHWAKPIRILTDGHGTTTGVAFERTAPDRDGRLAGTGEIFTIHADQVMKAIGQSFVSAPLNGSADTVRLEGGRIAVDEERRTSLADVWAGGDCIAGGEDLTVVAVEDGKVAAESIHRALGQ
jgi:glutamate synthase (NADPH/NADH) small chain